MGYSTGARGKYWKSIPVVISSSMPGEWQVAGKKRHRQSHPQTWIVGRDGVQYQVPIPRKSGWTSNAPLRTGLNWSPLPRQEAETEAMKKEREKEMKAIRNKKKQLNRKEKARCQVVATVQVFAAKPGENLFTARRGRPPKESQETVVLSKLKKLKSTDKQLLLEMFNALLDQISVLVKGGGDQKEIPKEIDVKVSVPTKRAIKKAAEKKAAEEVKEAADGDKPQAPEESLPKSAEPKEEEVIVAAVLQLGPLEKEVGRLKLDIATLAENCSRGDTEREKAFKELDDMKMEVERLRKLESGEKKERAAAEVLEERLFALEKNERAAAEVLERRFFVLEDQVREAKAKEVTVQELKKDQESRVLYRLIALAKKERVAAEVLKERIFVLEGKVVQELKSGEQKARDTAEILCRQKSERAAAEVLKGRIFALENHVTEEVKAKAVQELKSGEKKERAAVEVLEERIFVLENQVREAKAKEVAKPETIAIEKAVDGAFEKQVLRRLKKLESVSHAPYTEEREEEEAYEREKREDQAEGLRRREREKEEDEERQRWRDKYDSD